MAGTLVAGVDCSTQATKVLIVDPARGAVVAEGRAPHEVTGSGGARETDPRVWWDALGSALAQTGRAGDVAAVAVAGQQHGLVACDGQGVPLRPAVLWNDTRAAPDARDLTDALGGPQVWANQIGSVPVASFTVSSMAWLRRAEPDVAERVQAVRLPHDWLTERLCAQAVTDRGDASGTGWWSAHTQEYAEAVLTLEQVRLDAAALPQVLGPREQAGEVVPAAAEALGLARGAVVAAGTGDNMGAALGLGLPPGLPVMSLGTSGTVYVVSDSPSADVEGVVAGFADATGRYLPLACTLNATLATDRVARWLGLERDAVEEGGKAVVLPYFDGERTPNLPEAAATFTGLRHDTTPGQLLRATYEGVVASLLDAVDRLAIHSSGVADDAPLVLIGGGARSRVWQEVVGRLSGRPLVVPAASELVALGAAAQAAALLSSEPPAEVARRWGTRAGPQLPAVARDDATLERIRAVRRATAELNAAHETRSTA